MKNFLPVLVLTISLASCQRDFNEENFTHKITFINAGNEIDASTSLAFTNETKEEIKIHSLNDSIFEMSGTNDSMMVKFSFHDKKLVFGKVPPDFFNYNSEMYISINTVTPKTPPEWPLQSMNDYAVIQIAKDTDQFIQAISISGSVQIGIDIERLSDFR